MLEQLVANGDAEELCPNEFQLTYQAMRKFTVFCCLDKPRAAFKQRLGWGLPLEDQTGLELFLGLRDEGFALVENEKKVKDQRPYIFNGPKIFYSVSGNLSKV